jgi:gliding motility-associated-like protein
MADEVQSTCFSRTVVLEYTISNTNATDELPADTPIAFYIEDTLIAQSLTAEILPIGGTLNASISVDIDQSIPEQFEIIAVVDDLGDGNGIISEISETNNTASVSVEISNAGCPIFIPQGLSPNGDGLNDVFNILGLYDVFINHKLRIFNRYGTMVFEGDNDLKWDGSANRGPNPSSGKLPVGTYFYVLILNEIDYGPRSGWVYLNY